MRTKIIIGAGLALIAAICVPAIAISQNQTQTLCEDLNTLRYENVMALFTHFQGNDDLETATALMRQTTPDGRLLPAVSARFDAAAIALASDETHAVRQTRLTQLQTYPRARKFPSLQDTDIMWGEDGS